MANDTQDIGRWLQDLATRSVAEQARTAQRYSELLQRLGRGELVTRSLGDEFARFVREETTRYARNLATLSFSYYNAVETLSRSYNDRFFEQVLGVGLRESAKAPTRETTPDQEAPAPVAAQHTAVPRQVELALHAPLGEHATRSFVLENKRTEPAEISFLVSDFVGSSGNEPFRPALQFEPARFSIAPGEERQVTLRLSLADDLFVLGERYTATVLARGYDDLELVLHVWADLPAPAPAETDPLVTSTGATSDSAKKRKKHEPTTAEG